MMVLEDILLVTSTWGQMHLNRLQTIKSSDQDKISNSKTIIKKIFNWEIMFKTIKIINRQESSLILSWMSLFNIKAPVKAITRTLQMKRRFNQTALVTLMNIKKLENNLLLAIIKSSKKWKISKTDMLLVKDSGKEPLV